MSIPPLSHFLHKCYADVQAYGDANGYTVYKTYSEPSALIVPDTMKTDRKRLEVRMYHGYSCEYVQSIDRYEGGVLVEKVITEKTSLQSYLDSLFPNKNQQSSVINRLRGLTPTIHVFIGKGATGKTLFAKFLTKAFPDKYVFLNGYDNTMFYNNTVKKAILTDQKHVIICANTFAELTGLEEYMTQIYQLHIVPFVGKFTMNPDISYQFPSFVEQFTKDTATA
jgi:hypothetical protein